VGNFTTDFDSAVKRVPNYRLGKILVVDDDEVSGSALIPLPELEGFEVIYAADGQEPYLKAIAEPPDLILTGLNILNLSELDLIRLIKQEATLAAVPVVEVSAAEKQHLNLASEAGAAAVFQKPLEFDQVIAFLAALAVSRRRRPESIRIPRNTVGQACDQENRNRLRLDEATEHLGSFSFPGASERMEILLTKEVENAERSFI
jgi:DNA-binding response OmpR family regulator